MSNHLQKCLEKSEKMKRKQNILPKHRPIWLAFYPRSQKFYMAIGCKVVPYSRYVSPILLEGFVSVSVVELTLGWSATDGATLSNF